MKKKFAEISKFIEVGELIKAKEIALEINKDNIPRPVLVEYCSLLRRLGLSHQVIEVLNPFVRPKARSLKKATELELVEYSGALVRLGLTSEAFSILKDVDKEKAPRAYLIQGFAHIAESNYENANESFLGFLNRKKRGTEYEDLIAKINLLQGYTFLGDRESANQLIQELKVLLNPEKHKFLYVALLEFESEILRQNEKYDEALELVEKGIELLGSSETVDELLIFKQKAIILASHNRDISLLHDARKRAQKLGHIDTIRECDLYLGVLNKDKELLKRLYWGTPYQYYRKRVLDLAAGLLNKKELETYQFSGSPGEIIELENIRGLKTGQLPHRLLKILLSDLFAGQSKISIFNKLFSGEHYSPTHSSNRVQQILQRLKRVIEGENLPFAIQEKSGFFSIVATRPITLTLQSTAQPELKKVFGSRWFSVREVEAYYQVSWRTAHRRVKELDLEGQLEKRGRTADRMFRFNA